MATQIEILFNYPNIPLDTRRKSNVHKTFRRRLLNVLFTFSLRLVFRGVYLVILEEIMPIIFVIIEIKFVWHTRGASRIPLNI